MQEDFSLNSTYKFDTTTLVFLVCKNIKSLTEIRDRKLLVYNYLLMDIRQLEVSPIDIRTTNTHGPPPKRNYTMNTYLLPFHRSIL